MEDRSGDDQNSGVHKQGDGERQRGVDVGHADGLALARRRALVLAALHNRGMQVEVVRHHRCAQDSDGDVEHLGVGDDRGRGNEEVMQHRPVVGAGEEHLHAEHPRDGADQRDHQRLNVAEAPALHQENQQHVEAGDQHAIEERNVEEQVQGDGRADDLGQIACGDGDFGANPQRVAHAGAVALVAHLRQVALGGNSQLEREALQENRHQVRGHDDKEQRVAETRAAGDVGGPVAGVHVAHRDQESGTQKARKPPPVVRRAGNAHRRMNLRQRRHLVLGARRKAGDCRQWRKFCCAHTKPVCHKLLTIVNSFS